MSENERNAFPWVETEVVSKNTAPLKIEADLAPEDPRRFDLEQQTLSKLRRTMPNVTVDYVSGTSTGLFEQASARYGEIWYDLAGNRAVGRAATTDGVPDAIYELPALHPPHERLPLPPLPPLAPHPPRPCPSLYLT